MVWQARVRRRSATGGLSVATRASATTGHLSRSEEVMIQAAVRTDLRVTASGFLVLMTVLALPIDANAVSVSFPPTTTIGQGQTVDISVSADVADGIEGADLRITYDPAVVTPAGDAVS